MNGKESVFESKEIKANGESPFHCRFEDGKYVLYNNDEVQFTMDDKRPFATNDVRIAELLIKDYDEIHEEMGAGLEWR